MCLTLGYHAIQLWCVFCGDGIFLVSIRKVCADINDHSKSINKAVVSNKQW